MKNSKNYKVNVEDLKELLKTRSYKITGRCLNVCGGEYFDISEYKFDGSLVGLEYETFTGSKEILAVEVTPFTFVIGQHENDVSGDTYYREDVSRDWQNLQRENNADYLEYLIDYVKEDLQKVVKEREEKKKAIDIRYELEIKHLKNYLGELEAENNNQRQ